MTPDASAKPQSPFTLKAILAGLLGIFLVAGLGKIAPTLFKQELVTHQLGTGIYFYFLVLCAVWNPLAYRFFPKGAFSFREICVVMIATLPAGAFAFAGWLKQIYTQGIMLSREMTVNPRYRLYDVTGYLKKELLPGGGVYDERISGNFINGISAQKSWIPWESIPFDGWGSLLYWGGFLLLLSLMGVALLLVVHRQWSEHEQLSYPLASITESLIKKSDDKSVFADLFRSTAFRIALATVLLIHIYNFLVLTFSTLGFEPVKLRFWLQDIQLTFPVISQTGCWAIRSVNFTFLLIGLAYLLAPALSFSIGINVFIYIFFAAEVRAVTGQAPGAAECQLLRLGAYLAFVILLLSLGRCYYGRVLLFALGFKNKEIKGSEKASVLGCRFFLILFLGMVYFLHWSGLSLGISLLFTFVVVMTYLIFTRIVCECGLPLMTPPFLPSQLFTSLFGGAALGPKNIMGSGMFSGILFADLRQLLFPFAATALKIGQDARIAPRPLLCWLIPALVIALATAVPIHLKQYYSFGITDSDSKTSTWKIGIQESFRQLGKLHINNQVKSSAAATFKESLRSVMPEKSSNYTFVFIGMALVFICGFLRSRFVWWPLHAVIFCLWNTPLAFMIWPSFLLGGICRFLAVRLGGENGYLALKPFFLGLIFGDVAASGIMFLTGAVYYIITG